MNTIADFKRKMIPGAKVHSRLFWLQNGELKQVNEILNRECKISQSNSFALTMERNGKTENSWCDWPKKAEFTAVSENVAQIDFEGGRLIYEFIN